MHSPKLVGAAVNTQVKLQRVTPLLAACGTNKSPELIDWLLANGANPCAQDERGWIMNPFEPDLDIPGLTSGLAWERDPFSLSSHTHTRVCFK